MTDRLAVIAGWVALRALEGGVEQPRDRTAGGNGREMIRVQMSAPWLRCRGGWGMAIRLAGGELSWLVEKACTHWGTR